MFPKQVHEGSSDLLYVPKCIDSRHDQYPTQKGPLYFFCAALQLLITVHHRPERRLTVLVCQAVPAGSNGM